MRKTVRLILAGGIGNQFFQYCAALSLSTRLGSELFVDTTFSQLNRTGHSDLITSFELPGKFSRIQGRFSAAFIASLVRRCFRRLAAALTPGWKLRLFIFSTYASQVVGFDEKLNLISKPATILGFFQTWKHYSALTSSGVLPKIELRSKSPWLNKYERRLEVEGKVLGIHVRLGDYLHSETFGVLSAEYYVSALITLRQLGRSWDTIWVFSDDPVLAQERLSEVLSLEGRLHYVDSSESPNDCESLFLMSKCPLLVLANSSYSWWAAALNEDVRELVVCPERWTLIDIPHTDLYPTNWVKIASEWDYSLKRLP